MTAGIQRIRNGLRWRVEESRDALSTLWVKIRVALMGPYRCSACGQAVSRFNPLPSFYLEQQKKHGRTHLKIHGETCNYRAYSCPHCGASDRDRLYALYLTPWMLARAQGAETVLVDFAPAKSLSVFIRDFIRLNRVNLRYITSDLFMAGVEVKADICDMPVFQADSVDFFICSHVLEHEADDIKAMAELYRILKPGGQGILMVPINLKAVEIDEDPSVTDIGERWRRFGQDDHVREYSKNGFLARLHEAGFVVRSYGAKHFGRSSLWRCGISPQSVLYVVEKPR